LYEIYKKLEADFFKMEKQEQLETTKALAKDMWAEVTGGKT